MQSDAIILPRVIPALLLADEAMVKTTRFANPTYLGDPINVINLFNRFEVDEIALLDIGATVRGRVPAYDLIERLASECWVPLSYGGGIASYEDARTVLSIGVEKVILGAVAYTKPNVISEVAATYGSQAVVVSVDVRRTTAGRGEVFIESGRRPTGMDPPAYARRAEAAGAGEIFLNDIDRDGTMIGYDLTLVQDVVAAVGIPVIACGGAGERADLAGPIKRGGAAAVAAGSIFVFRGRERGVLINFPDRDQLEQLLG